MVSIVVKRECCDPTVLDDETATSTSEWICTCLGKWPRIYTRAHFLPRPRTLTNYCSELRSVAKLVRHSAIFWNLLDELRIRAKEYVVCAIYPRINVDHSFRHYGHFVSGQHCAGGRGDLLPGSARIFENSPQTVDCRRVRKRWCRVLTLHQHHRFALSFQFCNTPPVLALWKTKLSLNYWPKLATRSFGQLR